MTFESSIADLVRIHLTPQAGHASLAPLMRELGCRHVVMTPGFVSVYAPPSQPAPVHEDIVTATLIHAMALHQPRDNLTVSDNLAAILDGLLRKNRWRRCLESHATAFDFAVMMTCFWVARPQSPASQSLLREVAVPVCAVLNRWIRPQTPFTGDSLNGTSPTYDVACSLFGEAWCSIALSDAIDRPWDIPHIIRTHRPPLLPSLLPKRLETIAQTLPALEAP
jgi:hypothetical protein